MSSDETDAPTVASAQEPESAGTTEPAVLPRRRWPLLLVAAVVVYALDQVTKVLAAAHLADQEPRRVLGGLVYLQLVRNPGAAFGMATGMTWVLTLIMLAVIGAITWLVPRLRSAGWAVGLGFVLAGALGNLTDRLLRAPGPFRGHVVDFISVFAPNGDRFPVFNIADSGITVGGALIVLLAVLGREYDGRITRNREAATDE